MSHQKFIQIAFEEAEKAARLGEVPIGAVLVLDDQIIAKAHNRTRTDHDPTAHAEVLILREGARRIGNERILNSTLYVTLEPCVMCVGAIVQARISTVVFGAKDPNVGACGSAFRLLPNKKLNHRPVVIKNVLGEKCSAQLKDFFKARRKKKRD